MNQPPKTTGCAVKAVVILLLLLLGIGLCLFIAACLLQRHSPTPYSRQWREQNPPEGQGSHLF